MERQLSNGRWIDCTARADEFIGLAAEHNGIDRDAIQASLATGKMVRYGTDWNEKIRSASPAPVAPRFTPAPAHNGSCARCGNPGRWVSGAAEVLCDRHQDDY